MVIVATQPPASEHQYHNGSRLPEYLCHLNYPRKSSRNGVLCPKDRFNPKFIHLVNQHHKIVAEHLAQRLVDHCNVSLTPQRISELAFNHAESGFDVRTLVVMLQELCPLELEIVVHLSPFPATVASVMRREGNVRRSS